MNWLEPVLNILVPILVIYVMLMITLQLAKQIFPARNEFVKKGFIPTDPGERLKKYIIKASKVNPVACKVLKLQRTKYNEGGKIGKIIGVLPSKHITRFVFKKNIFSFPRIFYCPSHMHTDLHAKEVLVKAICLDNAGGFYYPVPYDEKSRAEIFYVMQSAFEIDLKQMLQIDLHQIHNLQILSSITGKETAKEFIRKPEEIKPTEIKSEEEVKYV